MSSFPTPLIKDVPPNKSNPALLKALTDVNKEFHIAVEGLFGNISKKTGSPTRNPIASTVKEMKINRRTNFTTSAKEVEPTI